MGHELEWQLNTMSLGRHPTSDSRRTLISARVAILLGPLASVLYGLDMAERHQSRSLEGNAELLQYTFLVVGTPLFLALVMPAVLILRRLWTTSTLRALLRRGGIALALPCGWLVFATVSQMDDLQRNDPDEWLFFSIAVLPCIVIVATRIAWLAVRGVSEARGSLC